MTKKIVILGTGGNCIDILDVINEINLQKETYECIGFLDDNPSMLGRSFYGVKVLGDLSFASQMPDVYFVNGIGSPFNFWNKHKIIQKTEVPTDKFETIIHPTASVSKLSQIDKGTVILQHVTVASNVKIGKHVMILPNSIISHDDIIGDYTSIAGGVCISGGVEVGESCYIGSKASIIGNIRIEDFCLIGIGSNVLSSVERNSVMVGNPAKYLRKTH